MLQQDEPDDYVVATGETNSLENFVSAVFSRLGMNWRDHVEHNPDLLRPTDILISRANPAKARKKLGWRAQYRMEDVVSMMVEAELQLKEKL